MADLNEIQAAQAVKIIGADSSGQETNPVNADSNGGILVAGEGTAGSPVGGVVTVQGVTNGTKLPVSFTPQIGKALDADRLISGGLLVESPTDDIFVEFSDQVPNHLVSTTLVNGGTVTQSNAQALVTSGTNTSGEASMTSRQVVEYRAGHETRADFTAAFTSPIASSSQYIGMFDDNNGFFIGYNGTTFNIGKRNGGSDTLVAQASWNGDKLNGSADSSFTRDGAPEAIDFTNLNLYRIRFQWLGGGCIWYEALSPDGNWVQFHSIKTPNTSSLPSILEPDLPLRSHVKKTTAGATSLIIKTSSWRGTSHSCQYTDRISHVNSTNVALGSSASFSGQWESTQDFSSVGLFFSADQNGTLTIDFSDDASTVRDTNSYTINTTNFTDRKGALSITPKWSFLRVTYTNGSSAQTTFALSTVFYRDATNTDQTPLSQNPSDKSLAIIAQAVIVGKTTGGGGGYVPVKVAPSGAVQVGGTVDVTGSKVTVIQNLGGKKTYIVNTGPITGATAVSTKSLAYLWHPSADTDKYQLVSVMVDQASGNGPSASQRIELRVITAENGTPGGSTGTIFSRDPNETSSGATLRIAPTGAPTRTSGKPWSMNMEPRVNGQIFPVGDDSSEMCETKPWSLAASANLGYEITQEVIATLSAAPTFNITFIWTEE